MFKFRTHRKDFCLEVSVITAVVRVVAIESGTSRAGITPVPRMEMVVATDAEVTSLKCGTVAAALLGVRMNLGLAGILAVDVTILVLD